MPKTNLVLPGHFTFTTEIPIRITDLNYGGHVGNDSVLSILHEVRMQFLRHHGYSEMDLAGTGIIMADAAIEFRSEVFYGETLKASVAATEFSRVGFDLYYKLEKQINEKNIQQTGSPENVTRLPERSNVGPSDNEPLVRSWITVAAARTGMVCYNYTSKKIVSVPKEVCTRLLS
ncbi:MAG: acyl-CoA thioesterase [Chitinophagaceae bacterium]|nr:acyl-CoA thioesterase [Chitinophagaceae bacterium]